MYPIPFMAQVHLFNTKPDQTLLHVHNFPTKQDRNEVHGGLHCKSIAHLKFVRKAPLRGLEVLKQNWTCIYTTERHTEYYEVLGQIPWKKKKNEQVYFSDYVPFWGQRASWPPIQHNKTKIGSS